MFLRNIPEDINVEELLSYFPEGKCKVALKGLHKRNAYYDIIEVSEKEDTFFIEIGRDSLYNALPEYMFHPIDRFCNLPKLEEKEKFAEQLEQQEKEMENAYRFFAPMDVQLMLYRVMVKEQLRPITETNKVLLDILGDRLTKEQLDNRFIQQAIPFLPCCKLIRGNKGLLTIMLRKIFFEEGLSIELHAVPTECVDLYPRYADGLDAQPSTYNDEQPALETTYVGNVYDEVIATYDIHYWSEDRCNEDFLHFIDEIELFRRFIEDYFLSVEEVLHFDITHDDPTLRLSDDAIYNYLDYNTNI